MPQYQLQITQLVTHPRYRIYREFLQTLIADRDIHTNGCPGLLYKENHQLCWWEEKAYGYGGNKNALIG